MSRNSVFTSRTPIAPDLANSGTYELLTAQQLAQRLNIPPSWVAQQTRERATDKIPHIRFGRWIRYEWLSPDLAAWLSRRKG